MRCKTVKVALVGLLVAAMLYVASYGLVRWRKLLVRREYYSNMKAGPRITDVGAGQDSRPSGVGTAKNVIAPIAEAVYTPLRTLEAVYWNHTRR